MQLNVGPYEAFFERHSLPQKGLFRISKAGRGEVFIDFCRWSMTLTNHEKVAGYFNQRRQNDANAEREGG